MIIPENGMEFCALIYPKFTLSCPAMGSGQHTFVVEVAGDTVNDKITNLQNWTVKTKLNALTLTTVKVTDPTHFTFTLAGVLQADESIDIEIKQAAFPFNSQAWWVRLWHTLTDDEQIEIVMCVKG
jgi:hypothetical protein